MFWSTVIAICGAGSLLAVRLATPATLDEPWASFLLFLLAPGVVILLLGAVHRAAGLVTAVALPFIWLILSRDPSDSPLLWLIPILSGLAILLAAGWAAGNARSLPACVGAVALALGALFWPAPGHSPDEPRVILLGIDGATWVRIDPLVSDGRMPCFEQLLEQGHRAKLRSLESLYSPQVWSTIATGCPVSVHGMEDMGNQQSEFRVGRIWDQLKAEGRSYGVCGWYFIWPPLPGLGEHDFVIPNTLAPDSETFPPEYAFLWKLSQRENPRLGGKTSYLDAGLKGFRHGVRLSTLRRAATDLIGRRLEDRTPRDQYWRSRKLLVAFQADVFAELIRTRRPELAAVLFRPVDSVSHMYWKYVEPEGFAEVTSEDIARYGGVIDEVYCEVDRAIGKIRGVAPRNANFVVVSDHGFRPLLDKKIAGWFCRIRTENLISALGLGGRVFGTNVDEKVYLRPMDASEEERESSLGRLETVLSEAHLAGEVSRVFEVEREEGMLRVTMAPRQGLSIDGRVVLDGQEHPFKDLFLASEEVIRSGAHHPDGIFLLAGPAAAKAVPADSLHVMDVAPTLAALLDLPRGLHWTGRPALVDPDYAERPVVEYLPPFQAASAPVEVDPGLRDKLKAIGYLE